MKRPALVAIGLATAAIVTPSFADNTDTSAVSVGGTVVKSLELTATNLVMPHVTRPVTGDVPGVPARVTLLCGAIDASNSVSYEPNSNPFAAGVPAASSPDAESANRVLAGAGATGTCAVLSISGEPSYNFLFTVTNVTNPTSPASGVLFDNVNCFDLGNQITVSGNTVTLNGSGNQTLRCGGRIRVSADTPAGPYSGASFTATVTYD